MDALYTAAAGMIAQNQQLALVAGNLANANSPGYLAQTGTFIAFPQGTVTRQGVSPGVVGSSSDGVALTSGLNPAASGVNQTNQPTDLAILGPGFFQVKTPAGISYTRDGHFSLDARGAFGDGGRRLGIGRQRATDYLGPRPLYRQSDGRDFPEQPGRGNIGAYGTSANRYDQSGQ